MLHPSVTCGDTDFKGMLAPGKHDIERFAALCNTLRGEALGCGGFGTGKKQKQKMCRSSRSGTIGYEFYFDFTK